MWHILTADPVMVAWLPDSSGRKIKNKEAILPAWLLFKSLAYPQDISWHLPDPSQAQGQVLSFRIMQLPQDIGCLRSLCWPMKLCGPKLAVGRSPTTSPTHTISSKANQAAVQVTQAPQAPLLSHRYLTTKANRGKCIHHWPIPFG
ncbi:hypothetical protein SAMN05192546_1011 [Tindallia californiensis]|uniref:Uncharacterized protein n=1 Tax=Tindallia californiensis TaxID=159292 RepID=A0A1H3I5Q5_9FIRM|nr:hypothetical protein SAMN05192546_1011 [Tindallia californiensis]